MNIIKKHRGLFLAEGIVFIILGILAVALPGVMTLGIELLIGWLFLIGGIFQGYRAFTARHEHGFYASLISAIFSVIIGIMLLAYPLTGVLTLTLLMIVYFVVDGILRLILAFQLRPLLNWGWLAVSAVFSLALGLLLWSGWPGVAGWALGLLVGINMLFFGSSLLTLALSTPSKQ